MTIRLTRFRSELAGKNELRNSVEGTLVPELLDLNIHNWVSEPTIENTWESDVTTARNSVEERWSLVQIPFRTFTINLTGLNVEDSTYLWSKIQRLLTKRLLVPVYPDVVRISTANSAGSLTISGDFADKRYFPGMKCFYVSWDSNSVTPANIEVVEIKAASDSSIILQSPGLSLNHTKFARMYPCYVSDPELTANMSMIADHVNDFTISIPELRGPTGIPAWTVPGNDPDVETFEQIPIFPFRLNRATVPDMKLNHSGTKTRIGRAFITSLETDRPKIGFTFNCTFTNRKDSADALRFLDYCRGRTNSFWFCTPGRFWEPTQVTATSVRVSSTIPLAEMRLFLKTIAFVFNDSEVILRRVCEITEPSANVKEIVFKDDNHGVELPANKVSLSSIKKIVPAYVCRNVADRYRENWHTGSKITLSFDIVELHNEQEVRLPAIDEVIAPISPENILNVQFYGSAGLNSIKDDDTDVTSDGDEIKQWNGSSVLMTHYLKYDSSVNLGRYRYEASGLFPYRADNWDSFNPNNKAYFLWNDDSPLHDNGLGMTIFMTVRAYDPTSYEGLEDFLVAYPNAGYVSSDIFKWSLTKVTMNENEGIDNEENNIICQNLGEPFAGHVVIALIWKPGRFAKVYANGLCLGSAIKPVQEMPSSLTLNPMFVRKANEPGDSDSVDDWSVKHIAVFNRALDLNEFNSVGQYLGLQITTTWGKVLSFHG